MGRDMTLCDVCSRPAGEDHYTDEEVVGATDAPGFVLCARPDCLILHRGRSVESRRALYEREVARRYVVSETTEIGQVRFILAREGLSIERITSSGGTWHCMLRVDPAHRVDDHATGSEGSGPSLASAIEAAREGWIRYRRLAVRA